MHLRGQRALDRLLVSEDTQKDRPNTRVCSATDCFRTTRASKPMCTEHIERMPYVSDVKTRMTSIKRETQTASDSGRVAIDGALTSELLACLRAHGETSIPRIARYLGVSEDIAMTVANTLRRESLVRMYANRRGVCLVSLKAD